MHREQAMDRRKPYRPGDYEFVRAGREGAYWRTANGMVVRMAAAEPERAPDTDADLVWYVPLVALFNQAWQR